MVIRFFLSETLCIEEDQVEVVFDGLICEKQKMNWFNRCSVSIVFTDFLTIEAQLAQLSGYSLFIYFDIGVNFSLREKTSATLHVNYQISSVNLVLSPAIITTILASVMDYVMDPMVTIVYSVYDGKDRIFMVLVINFMVNH